MLSQNGGTSYPVMWHHTSEEHNYLLHCCKNLKAHICILHLLYLHVYTVIFFYDLTTPSGPVPPHYRGCVITFRHATLSRTPIYEWSVQRRDLYLTTHDSHKRQTFMPAVGFEPTILASEWLQTQSLDGVATGISTSTVRSSTYDLNKAVWHNRLQKVRIIFFKQTHFSGFNVNTVCWYSTAEAQISAVKKQGKAKILTAKVWLIILCFENCYKIVHASIATTPL